MKQIKTILLVLILLTGFTTMAFAQLYIAEPDIMPLSIRAVGMGGAFLAIADDEYALFQNPAGLGTFEGFAIPIMSIGSYFGDIYSSFVSDSLLVDENGERISLFDVASIFANLTRIFAQLGEGQGLNDFATQVMNTEVSINAIPSINAGVITKNIGIRIFDYTSVNLQFNRIGFLTEIDILSYADAGIIGGMSFQLADFMYVGFNLKYVKRIMISKDGIGLATLLRFIPADDTGDTVESLLRGLNSLGMVKTGDGIGSDLGILVQLNNLRIGVTITDWWGGTVINYFQTNVFRPLENTGKEDELKGIIPTSLNVGVAVYFDNILLPKWIIGDYIFALDIRDLLEFKIQGGEPSFDKTFFRNIYMGAEFKMFDFPGVRNIFMLPLTVNVGFYQGNLSMSLQGTMFWFFDIGIAIWGEERGDRIGQSRVYNFAFTIEFGI